MFEICCDLSGRFKLQKFRKGLLTGETPWFSNHILNQGLDVLGANISTPLLQCVVGTESTPPSDGQTQLVSQIAASSLIASSQRETSNVSPYWTRKTNVYQFNEGAAAGNLSEVGIALGAGNPAPLFSRELIRDDEGNPTTITVLPDEILQVTYEITAYPTLSDLGGNISIGSGDHDFIVRASRLGVGLGLSGWQFAVANTALFSGAGTSLASNVMAFDGEIGPVTGSPSGTSAAATSVSRSAYTAGNYFRDVTAVWAISAANFPTGIQSVELNLGSPGVARFQLQFDPPVTKDNESEFSLVFRHSWARRT